MGEPSCYSIVSEALSETNYQNWSFEVRQYLMGRDLWNIVEKGKEESLSLSVWKQKDAAALHAILISCSPRIRTRIDQPPVSAWSVWTSLANMFSQQNPAPAHLNLTYHMWLNPLFKAVYNGEWNAAKMFLDQNPRAVAARCPGIGSNALQIAIAKENIYIVEELLRMMTAQDLELVRSDGYTALAIAIEVGNLRIAECLVTKNRGLLTISQQSYGIPVMHALTAEQNHMVKYLYDATPTNHLTWLDNGVIATWVLSECIHVQRFDIALHLLIHAPYLALIDITKTQGISPVWALAQSKAFLRECPLNFFQKRIYNRIRVPNNGEEFYADIQSVSRLRRFSPILKLIKRIFIRCMEVLLLVPLFIWRWLDIKGLRKNKLFHSQTSELLNMMCKEIKDTLDEVTIKNAKIHDALRRAACAGNVEFITSIVQANQSLLWNSYTARTVFEDAIRNRQEKVFSLVYSLPNRTAIVSYRDENHTNMLHKAAALAPSALRKRIPGAALQMQRELQWFKAVEELASLRAREANNSEFLKPRDLFTQNHKELVVEGEKWMKDTASSSTVVGALIVTITFAAAFTFPGGNNQNSGFPIFLNDRLYRVFMMSNAVGLFSSTTSVLMFLGILTSRYGEEDFLYSLPKKLIIGLSTLFLSIAAMIIAFCAGLSIMFHNKLWIVVPSICLAAVPIAFFVLMQFPLLVEIAWSTYGPSIFDRNVERWI